MSDKWVGAHPRDIIWSNIDHDDDERSGRFLISWAATVGLVILWAFPVAFIGSLSNITSLCGKSSWVKIPVYNRTTTDMHYSWLQFVCNGTYIVTWVRNWTDLDLQHRSLFREYSRVLSRLSSSQCFLLWCPIYFAVCLITQWRPSRLTLTSSSGLVWMYSKTFVDLPQPLSPILHISFNVCLSNKFSYYVT